MYILLITSKATGGTIDLYFSKDDFNVLLEYIKQLNIIGYENLEYKIDFVETGR